MYRAVGHEHFFWGDTIQLAMMTLEVFWGVLFFAIL